MKRLWPTSLRGQVLLAIALALMLAQGVSAVLLYRGQHERGEMTLLHTAAFRLVMASRNGSGLTPAEQGPRQGYMHGPQPPPQDGTAPEIRNFRLEHATASPQRPGEARVPHDEEELREILIGQEVPVEELVVVRRMIGDDQVALRQLSRRMQLHLPGPEPERVLVAGLRLKGSQDWMLTRVLIPGGERLILQSLLIQTLFIYAVLFGAMVFILGRITRPLAALRRRLEEFAQTHGPNAPLEPEGPEDLRRLIEAHNTMVGRIAALLDEKDVMLGAIGHDLKTPLAALRVRIESVEDEAERGRMARTIEDITRSLDDILSLARVGRPSDPVESTELSALVASVVEEYEDMGEPVELADTERIVLALRPTWLRRALRNLVGNGLRYGRHVRVALSREGGQAVVRISDDGPGIAEDQIARMMEPFTRGDPSRNSETGGAGLGLTLARAIAEQHGGALVLANRHGADGKVEGLDAVLRIPV